MTLYARSAGSEKISSPKNDPKPSKVRRLGGFCASLPFLRALFLKKLLQKKVAYGKIKVYLHQKKVPNTNLQLKP